MGAKSTFHFDIACSTLRKSAVELGFSRLQLCPLPILFFFFCMKWDLMWSKVLLIDKLWKCLFICYRYCYKVDCMQYYSPSGRMGWSLRVGMFPSSCPISGFMLVMWASGFAAAWIGDAADPTPSDDVATENESWWKWEEEGLIAFSTTTLRCCAPPLPISVVTMLVREEDWLS